jgi:hypothetical protein
MSQSNVSQSNIREELRRAPVEPLLPIEKKLIAWSLTIGLVLLVGLALLNHFVPATF